MLRLLGNTNASLAKKQCPVLPHINRTGEKTIAMLSNNKAKLRLLKMSIL
jgi:hypothetical protein